MNSSSHSRDVHGSNQNKHSTSNSNNSNTSSLDHPSNNEIDQLALISSKTSTGIGTLSPPDIQRSKLDCITGPLPSIVGVDLMNTYSTGQTMSCQRNVYHPSFDLVPMVSSQSDQINQSPLNTPTPPSNQQQQLPITSIGNHTNYLNSSFTGHVSMINPSSGKIYGSIGRSSVTSLGNQNHHHQQEQQHHQHFHSPLTTYDTLNSSDTSGFMGDVTTETSTSSNASSQRSHQQKQQLQLNHQHLYSGQEGSI